MANVSSFSGAMPVIPGGLVELGYSEITSDVNVVSTTAGSGTPVISALTVVCDGGPLLVEFFSAGVVAPSTSGGQIFISLYQDGSEKSRYWSNTSNPAAAVQYAPVHLQYRTTPSAGSHTFDVRSFVSSTTGTPRVSASSTTTGNAPAFLRVSKIVNQNDGLKPFWTPPVVTQLPSQATEGDQVLLYSSSPYAGYQTNQYATGSWRALNDSRGVDAWQSWTPTLAQGASTNITKTVFYAKYIQFGKTVNASVYLRAGAVGTAGSAITISLPVTAAASSSQPVGSAFYFQNVGVVRSGTAAIASSTTAGLVIDPGAGFTTPRFLGVNPTATVANLDFVLMTMTYEAA